MTCVLRATCRDRRSGWRAAVRLLKRQKKKYAPERERGKIESRASARTPFVEERLVPSFIHKNNVTRRHYTQRGTKNQKYLHWCGTQYNTSAAHTTP